MTQTQKLDFGSVQIHKKVIADIVYNAICEIQGVHLISKNFGQQLTALLGQKEFSGIDVKVDGEQGVTLEVKVVVRYGLNIPDIARQIQNVVKNAIERTADIHLKEVNVNIQGIDRPQS